MIVLQLIGVVVLLGLNAFFAAAEFSLVTVRLSRIRQVVAQGDLRARVAEQLLGEIPRVVSGVQVGITLTSLAIGALGEDVLAKLLQRIWPSEMGTHSGVVLHSVALACAFALLSASHVVFGELVPKMVSLARAERVALMIAIPFHGYLRTFSWAISLLEGISAWTGKLFGISSGQAHGGPRSTEELQIQIQQARERGLLAPGEEKFITSAIELSRVQVREIMVPRPDMVTLAVEASLEEVMRVFATTQRSRIPVYRASEDHVLGFVHIKDMLWVLLDRERRVEEGAPPSAFDLRRVLREVLIVPETKPASELLLELRTHRIAMAMVVDEFGSILGLVTLEDIIEQVVGEIYDEFDVVERPLTLANGAIIFDAALNVRDLDTQYNITLPEDPAYATVGGFVLDQLGFIPKGGESFDYNGFRFNVVEMDGKRVARVKVERVRPPATESPAEAPDKPSTPESPAHAGPKSG